MDKQSQQAQSPPQAPGTQSPQAQSPPQRADLAAECRDVFIACSRPAPLDLHSLMFVSENLCWDVMKKIWSEFRVSETGGMVPPARRATPAEIARWADLYATLRPLLAGLAQLPCPAVLSVLAFEPTAEAPDDDDMFVIVKPRAGAEIFATFTVSDAVADRAGLRAEIYARAGISSGRVLSANIRVE